MLNSSTVSLPARHQERAVSCNIGPSVQPKYSGNLTVWQWAHARSAQIPSNTLISQPMCHMSLSSGGTLSMLSISSRAPASSWALGLYAPSDWRFFLAVSTMKVKPMIAISTQKHSSGMATISQGIPCLWACFCEGMECTDQNTRSCFSHLWQSSLVVSTCCCAAQLPG